MNIQDAHTLTNHALEGVRKLFKSTQSQVVSDSGKDLKLNLDLEASKHLIKVLSTSGHKVVSEEEHQNNFYPDEIYWVIDPLDGTFNYSRNFPYYCCAIALVKGQEPLYGQILNLVDGTSIFGGKGLASGLTLTETKELGKAGLLTGFPLEFNFAQGQNDVLKFYSQFKKIRMIGSAASSLALVAKGVFDLYHEKNIYFWDVAAGLAIIEASGGHYKALFQKDSWKLTVAAGNKHLVQMVSL